MEKNTITKRQAKRILKNYEKQLENLSARSGYNATKDHIINERIQERWTFDTIKDTLQEISEGSQKPSKNFLKSTLSTLNTTIDKLDRVVREEGKKGGFEDEFGILLSVFSSKPATSGAAVASAADELETDAIELRKEFEKIIQKQESVKRVPAASLENIKKQNTGKNRQPENLGSKSL